MVSGHSGREGSQGSNMWWVKYHLYTQTKTNTYEHVAQRDMGSIPAWLFVTNFFILYL